MPGWIFDDVVLFMEIPEAQYEDHLAESASLWRQRLQKVSRTVRFARGQVTDDPSREDFTHFLDQGDGTIWREVFSM